MSDRQPLTAPAGHADQGPASRHETTCSELASSGQQPWTGPQPHWGPEPAGEQPLVRQRPAWRQRLPTRLRPLLRAGLPSPQQASLRQRWRRDPSSCLDQRWAAALERASLGAMAVALALAALLLDLVPQRLAQRPARQGVIVLHLAADGRLRLWNQPLSPAQLLPLLNRAARDPRRPRLRLKPDAGVPWGRVQALAAQLESLSLPLELQLP